MLTATSWIILGCLSYWQNRKRLSKSWEALLESLKARRSIVQELLHSNLYLEERLSKFIGEEQALQELISIELHQDKEQLIANENRLSQALGEVLEKLEASRSVANSSHYTALRDRAIDVENQMLITLDELNSLNHGINIQASIMPIKLMAPLLKIRYEEAIILEDVFARRQLHFKSHVLRKSSGNISSAKPQVPSKDSSAD
jgi:hypothetical protein